MAFAFVPGNLGGEGITITPESLRRALAFTRTRVKVFPAARLAAFATAAASYMQRYAVKRSGLRNSVPLCEPRGNKMWTASQLKSVSKEPGW